MSISSIVLVLVATLIWGSGFIAIELGLNHFPPLLFIALRFIISAVPLVFFIDRAGIKWRWIISIGLAVGVFFYVFWYLAMWYGMPAGMAALLLQTQFIFTTLLSILLFRKYPNIVQIFAMAVCSIGLYIIARERLEGITPFLPFLIIMGGAASWGLVHIIMQKAGKMNQLRLMVWVSLIPPIPLLILSYIFESNQLDIILNMDHTALLALLYTGIPGTVISFAIWGHLIQKHGAVTIAPFSMLIPVFAIVLSIAFLNEDFSVLSKIGASVIFLGLLVNAFNVQLSTVFARRSKKRPLAPL
ncbi:EamA family transporter [Marinobacter lacisalsi]|uniref:EamA family transporter n=1 Tax=Marinobacter lacisalsi TaxID=475979 RepID=A0ABV8QF38_9GAMM